MNSRKVRGIVMAAIGGVILLVNALAYLFNWDFANPPMSIIGILFLGAGLALARKS